MTRVARCPHCQADILAVAIGYMEKEDAVELFNMEKRGFTIHDIESKDLNMDYLAHKNCPKNPNDKPVAQGELFNAD